MHSSILAGHPGSAKTLELISRHFFFPDMKQFVINKVTKCHVCQVDKSVTRSKDNQVIPIAVSLEPFQSISFDIVSSLPKSINKYDSVLVVIDRFSKYSYFIPISISITAAEIIDLLINHIFKIHGFPVEIMSDRDPRWTSNIFTNFMKSINIKQSMSTSYHPQSDGSSERVIRSLIEYIRHYVKELDDKSKWDSLFDSAHVAYNNRIHSATGFSPSFLVFNRQINLPFNLQSKPVKSASLYVEEKINESIRSYS